MPILIRDKCDALNFNYELFAVQRCNHNNGGTSLEYIILSGPFKVKINKKKLWVCICMLIDKDDIDHKLHEFNVYLDAFIIKQKKQTRWYIGNTNTVIQASIYNIMLNT